MQPAMGPVHFSGCEGVAAGGPLPSSSLELTLLPLASSAVLSGEPPAQVIPYNCVNNARIRAVYVACGVHCPGFAT